MEFVLGNKPNFKGFKLMETATTSCRISTKNFENISLTVVVLTVHGIWVHPKKKKRKGNNS